MPDWITPAQKIVGRLTTRRLFGFTPQKWDKDRILHDDMRATQSALGVVLGPRLFSRSYPGVPGRIHIHETMLPNDTPEEIQHYVAVGESAIDNLERALKVAGKRLEDVQACLDMPSGFGRVTRHLAKRIPAKRITACEIDKEALRFLAAEFGVKTVRSKEDFRKIAFPEKYELIFVGSLMTHLPPDRGWQLIETLVEQLRVGGVLVFTTQGERCLEKLPMYGWMFKDLEREFSQKLADEGTAFAPYYPADPKWGIALHSNEYIESEMGRRFEDRLGFLKFRERGWDHHQDVWAFQRKAPKPV